MGLKTTTATINMLLSSGPVNHFKDLNKDVPHGFSALNLAC